MKPRLIAVAVVASSVALLAACGGAKDSGDLFGTPSSSDFGTDTSKTEPAPSTSSTSGGGSSTSSGGTTSSSGGSTTSSGGSTSGGTSSGGTTSSSGGSTSSSGGTTTSKGIWCGEDNDGDAIYCKSGTACCATDGGWGGPQLECSSGPACTSGVSIKCDDQTDCPTGNVCCGTFEQNSGYKQVSCAPTCQSAGGSFTAVRFCDPKAAVDECAAIGKTCSWSQSLPGYSVCK